MRTFTCMCIYAMISANEVDPLAAVSSHLDQLITHGTDTYGEISSSRWVASLDLDSLKYPDGNPGAEAGKRAYRDIDSPRGSNIYLDLPQIIAAHACARLTGRKRFADAADDYLRTFLRDGISPCGLLLWGHHYYYDVFADRYVTFHNKSMDGTKHELRPWGAPWELLEKIDAHATERAIDAMSGHVHLPTGAFDRHGSPVPRNSPPTECAFIEAGGVLVESFAWLAKKRRDPAQAERALRVAQWSFAQRDGRTGLLRNNPGDEQRWDYRVATSEIGVWAQRLAHAAELCRQPEFLRMSDAAMSSWLTYAWDPDARLYWGAVQVEDGLPIHDLREKFAPKKYSDIWNARFPSHDYPLIAADACVTLLERTGRQIYRDAVRRWAEQIERLPASARTTKDGEGEYAELYGRGMLFLVHAARVTGEEYYSDLARDLAQQAITSLYYRGMFRGHAGEDRYAAVDGVGFLLLGLMAVATGEYPQTYGMSL